MADVGVEGGVRVAGPQVAQRCALPCLRLSAVVGQDDGVGMPCEGGEQSAGADLRQLRRVPDQDERAARGPGSCQQLREGAGVGHGCLIDHQHPAGGQADRQPGRLVPPPDLGEQSGQRRRGGAGRVLEPARRDRRDRATEHRPALGLPDPDRSRQGRGLARAGRTDHHRQPGCFSQRADHRELLVRQLPPRRRGAGHVIGDPAPRCAPKLVGDAEGGLFDTEQLGRGPAGAVLAASRETDGVPALQDPVGDALDCRPIHSQPGRERLADGLQQVPAVEAGGLSREPGRTKQVLDEPVQRRRRRRAASAQDRVDHAAWVVSDGPRRGRPSLAQRRLRLGGRLVRPGVQTSRLSRLRAGSTGGAQGLQDLLPAGGEGADQVVGYAGELGDALLGRRPCDAEPVGQLDRETRRGTGTRLSGRAGRRPWSRPRTTCRRRRAAGSGRPGGYAVGGPRPVRCGARTRPRSSRPS